MWKTVKNELLTFIPSFFSYHHLLILRKIIVECFTDELSIILAFRLGEWGRFCFLIPQPNPRTVPTH